MSKAITRRDFLRRSGGGLAAAAVFGGGALAAGARKGPRDFIIVEGHRDIWEFNDRFARTPNAKTAPLRDHLLPRLIEGGVDVVIMPAGGDSAPERGGRDRLFMGSMRVVDMLLTEIEKTDGRASLILKRADIPTGPLKDEVRFFLDIEGGASIEIDPEPEYHPDRRLALLRDFYRLGCRGLQLTHHGRNQLADGWWEGKTAGRLSRFGVEVVKEMNRIGMMIGVSHLSATGVFHVAEITSRPIVSTHTNLVRFLHTDRQHTDEEVKAIASTGGLVGVRYMEGAPYKVLADEIEYMAALVGVEHVGIGWLGHDRGHPYVGQLPGVTRNGRTPTGIEAQSMYEHWDGFMNILRDRGFRDDQLALILGGNYVRIWNEVLAE
jgi:membrane dipeptidase